jgi:hypothetical protein
VFDVVGASAGLAVFAPAMAVIAAAVLIDDGRPVFFRQERVGYRPAVPHPEIPVDARRPGHASGTAAPRYRPR